jgi:soluble lytic murein transglycosylase-like protein
MSFRVASMNRNFRCILLAVLPAVMAGPILPAAVHAATQIAPQPEPDVIAAADGEAKPPEQPPAVEPKVEAPKSTGEPASSFRAAVRALVEQEVRNTGLPADIADAVVHVESNYNPSVIGGVGEIGLMQVRPETAAMLGFRGSAEELAKPEINIHYGVTYLSKAWRLANGDLCRTLMKYRAGHGEEVMSPRSQSYCNRARNHLAALSSRLATGDTPPPAIPASVLANITPKPALISPKDVYAQYKQGTPAASRAFWAAHEARIRAIKAQIESRWRRLASR